MKLGIDFGTTNFVATVEEAKQGEVIQFKDKEGQWHGYYPSLAAIKGSQICYGFEALALSQDPEWVLLRNLKSLLHRKLHHDTLEIRGEILSTETLLQGLIRSFYQYLQENSDLSHFQKQANWLVSIAIPFMASNQQRYQTLDYFRQEGVKVANLMSEPSAACMQFASYYYRTPSRCKKDYAFIYDLGGGTFDAAIAMVKDQSFQIVASGGDLNLGGVNFDETLFQLICKEHPWLQNIEFGERASLLENCRRAKEALTPQSKYVAIQWVGKEERSIDIKLPLEEYEEACLPLIQKTIEISAQLLQEAGIEYPKKDLLGFYLVGGASLFPAVARQLSLVFGKATVRKSSHASQAIALGLGVLNSIEGLSSAKAYNTHHLGKWRESTKGGELVFEPIFEEAQKQGETKIIRKRYHPRHNIGVFSFQDCSRIHEGKPLGIVTQWDQIICPLEAELEGVDLKQVPVVSYNEPKPYEVEEVYEVTIKGTIYFHFINHQTGYTQSFPLRPALN